MRYACCFQHWFGAGGAWPGGRGRDRAVARYLAHLIGCALSGRESKGLPNGRPWDGVVSRARDNGILDLVWRAIRTPGDVRESCQRFSDMFALHNVRYEVGRAAVCKALRAEGLSVLPPKGANLVSRYPDYSMREVGDNYVLYGRIKRDSQGCLSQLFS